MKDGRVSAVGTPHEVVTEAVVRDVFGLDNLVITDPVSGTPLVLPAGRHHSPSTTLNAQLEGATPL